MKKSNWFSVSTAGLKELQAGKPKHYILRELIANAFDEDINTCEVKLTYSNRTARIKVADDNPFGFKDLADAYTLFKSTSKRKNPSQRGRFNIGEKQAIALCETAMITTTKGTVLFTKNGRVTSRKKSDKGSKVNLDVKMTKKEYSEILEMIKNYLPPKNVKFIINDEQIAYKKPIEIIGTSLETELLENNIIKKVQRKTKIQVIQKSKEIAYLYEMGIPICKIECNYSIDIQQKIPLSIDRDTVSTRYLSDIYAEVLNKMYQSITDIDSSQLWIREAMSNKRLNKEAIDSIIHKRYGEKVVIGNPFDKASIDEAISNEYKVITGNELSKKEWENIKCTEVIRTSTELFGAQSVIGEMVEPNETMKKVVILTKKIAKECMNMTVDVKFAKWNGCLAQYSHRTIEFNVKKLGKNFFNFPISEKVLDIIIHELAHEKGSHIDMTYQQALTRIGSKLIIIALSNPAFFK